MKLGIENENLEYKKSTSELKEGVDSICAMLNKSGHGELFFGIKPDGSVIGQTVTERTLREVSQRIREGLEPKIYPTIEKVVLDGKDCIKVTFSGKDTPYFAFGVPKIRVADEDLTMTPKEVANYIRKKAIEEEGWENLISNKTIADADDEVVRKFIDKGRAMGRIPFEYTDTPTVLNKLELTSGNNLLNAGKALFCGDIKQDIQMAVFATSERLTFLDMQRKHGPILTLVDEAVSYIASKINWRVEITGTPQRNEIPEVPIDAVRELILNSWCHKDFTSATSNEVTIHPDRIEIFNPGQFPEGYKPEDFTSGKERPIRRNPLITRTLYFTKDIESFATGLKRVADTCDEAGVKYEFKQLKSGFVAILYRNNRTSETASQTDVEAIFLKMSYRCPKDVLKMSERELKCIIASPNITSESIAKEIGISERTVRRHIKVLKDVGIIRRVGSRTDGYWELVDE